MSPDGPAWLHLLVEGLDPFAFDGDRIASKSAFRKDRPVLPAAGAAAA